MVGREAVSKRGCEMRNEKVGRNRSSIQEGVYEEKVGTKRGSKEERVREEKEIGRKRSCKQDRVLEGEAM